MSKVHASRRSMRTLASTVAAMAAVGLAAGAPAHASKTCSAPKYPGVGYFTSLSVSGASCSKASSVAKAQYRCRTKNGKAGQCHKAVLGFHCSETRQSIPTEIDARVTCRKGSSSVIFTYQQDL